MLLAHVFAAPCSITREISSECQGAKRTTQCFYFTWRGVGVLIEMMHDYTFHTITPL